MMSANGMSLRCVAHLDLQEIITANALVVHLVVGIIGIASALIFDEGKAEDISMCRQHEQYHHSQSAGGSTRSWYVTSHKASVSSSTKISKTLTRI